MIGRSSSEERAGPSAGETVVEVDDDDDASAAADAEMLRVCGTLLPRGAAIVALEAKEEDVGAAWASSALTRAAARPGRGAEVFNGNVDGGSRLVAVVVVAVEARPEAASEVPPSILLIDGLHPFVLFLLLFRCGF